VKVAHLCIVTPGQCGLYETTREIVCGLRKQGVDSRLIDIPSANKVYKDGYPHDADRGAPLARMAWATKADIIVNHSGYDKTPIEKTDQPIVHIVHGRPRSSFISERKGGTPIYSYHYQKNKDPRFKAVVTFWPEHIPYIKVMFPDKPIHCVPAGVDLDFWCPGESDYDFHGNTGEFNIVLTDAWRDDIDPYLPLNAAALYARQKCAKIHLYAVPKDLKGFSAIIARIRDDGNMGELVRWTTRLREVYRKADVLFTANTINTRSVREAMACGCPVVRIGEDLEVVMLRSRDEVRILAAERFSMDRFTKQFIDVLRTV